MRKQIGKIQARDVLGRPVVIRVFQTFRREHNMRQGWHWAKNRRPEYETEHGRKVFKMGEQLQADDGTLLFLEDDAKVSN